MISIKTIGWSRAIDNSQIAYSPFMMPCAIHAGIICLSSDIFLFWSLPFIFSVFRIDGPPFDRFGFSCVRSVIAWCRWGRITCRVISWAILKESGCCCRGWVSLYDINISSCSKVTILYHWACIVLGISILTIKEFVYWCLCLINLWHQNIINNLMENRLPLFKTANITESPKQTWTFSICISSVVAIWLLHNCDCLWVF